MKEALVIFGMLIGGLGIFMLAVSMITDGLKSAAGHALRDMLHNWTRSPLHGIFTGVAITAIVQSSSAVTVATIGFVNAGIIGMRRALGIVFGSNIGTTMTGWLVAIIGFKINVEAFALPMIGIGMLLRLTGGETRRSSIGLALVGFGLFFIGIDVLKDAFGSLVGSIDLSQLTVQGFGGVLAYVGIGFLMTVLTQSSSAAIAITLTAATGGVLSINAAAAMVIGANVGTTSTAAIAVIGATPNAKRVASAHILFNAGTGLVALLILPVMFWIVRNTGELLGLQDIPAVTLALFHTVFNIIGVLLIFPLTDRLATFLEGRFVTQEEIEGQPRHLDKTVSVAPLLAVHALVLEQIRVIAIVRRMAVDALSEAPASRQRVARDNTIVENLFSAISEFITHLERGSLSEETSSQLAAILRAQQHLLTCADEAVSMVRHQAGVSALEEDDLNRAIRLYYRQLEELMALCNMDNAEFELTDCERQLERVEKGYEDLKALMLQAGVELRVPIPVIIDIIDQNGRAREIGRSLFKALRRLAPLAGTLEAGPAAAEMLSGSPDGGFGIPSSNGTEDSEKNT